ncbi:cytochrome P450, partial [Diaporthe sp. PMI_573]
LRESIRAAQEAGGCCGSRVIEYGDAVRLPFFQACLKEALRIHNPVPMGLPRVALKGGLRIGETTLPEGTTMSVSPWVIHHSKEIFGPDALRPASSLLGEKENSQKNYKYWCPFGAGYMSCPGQNYAKMELSKTLSTIVRDYDLRLVDPTKPRKWKAWFTMVPYDWPVYVSKSTLS